MKTTLHPFEPPITATRNLDRLLNRRPGQQHDLQRSLLLRSLEGQALTQMGKVVRLAYGVVRCEVSRLGCADRLRDRGMTPSFACQGGPSEGATVGESMQRRRWGGC